MHVHAVIFFFLSHCSLPQGTHSSLKGNSKALSTVTAIIDGTGTIGAAVGPLLTGVLNPTVKGWNPVFWMLVLSELIGAVVSRIYFCSVYFDVFVGFIQGGWLIKVPYSARASSCRASPKHVWFLRTLVTLCLWTNFGCDNHVISVSQYRWAIEPRGLLLGHIFRSI